MLKSKYFEPGMLKHFSKLLGSAKVKIILEKDDLAALYRCALEKIEAVKLTNATAEDYTDSYGRPDSELMQIERCKELILTTAQLNLDNCIEVSKLSEQLQEQIENFIQKVVQNFGSEEATILKFLAANNNYTHFVTHLNHVIITVSGSDPKLVLLGGDLKHDILQELRENRKKQCEQEELNEKGREFTDRFEVTSSFESIPARD